MTRAEVAEARAFASWQDYQTALVRAIALLTADQLQRRMLPTRRTPGELAQHIVFGRAFHLRRTLGQEAAHLEPLLTWGGPGDPPRSAAEIVDALELTWQVIAGHLQGGSPGDAMPNQEQLQSVWGLLDHDSPHAGQLSLLLRAAGLPGVDI